MTWVPVYVGSPGWGAPAILLGILLAINLADDLLLYLGARAEGAARDHINDQGSTPGGPPPESSP